MKGRRADPDRMLLHYKTLCAWREKKGERERHRCVRECVCVRERERRGGVSTHKVCNTIRHHTHTPHHSLNLMSVTLETSHSPRGWLNASALLNTVRVERKERGEERDIDV